MPIRTTCTILMFAVAGTVLVASCASLTQTQTTQASTQTHGGIRYSIHPDQRMHRIEKGANGRLMYDSPELTVVCEAGQLSVNGQPAGPVQKGDHVAITEYATVLVNGQLRGDVMTGYHQNRQRLKQSPSVQIYGGK